MELGARIAEGCTRRPKTVAASMLLVTAVIAAAAALPSLWPARFAFLSPVRVDTDPENMLSRDEAVRVFHDQMKHVLTLHDMVVVGVVDETNPDGVFNPKTLRNIYELTQYAKTLRWEENGRSEGVVEVDIIAPSTVDHIEQAGIGAVRFEWLMSAPPRTVEEARAIRDKALRVPFLNGTLVSEDGQAICLYLPLTRKDLSHRAYVALNRKIAEFAGDEKYYITGLPVAEDVFGVEMFVQMAISAPAAMLVIFLLMLVFFRKLVLVLSPMILAMVTVIVTMGLLIVAGYPVHIMSSMIPIFIMPIAVLDSVHILSEFFDRYQATRDRQRTIVKVMDELFMPMLYTSLTSVAGFASLALTPIPPVQVFGAFVALGIAMAWLLTVTFIPAYVMLIPARRLEGFGAVHHAEESEEPHGWLARWLQRLGGATYRQVKPILALALVALFVAGYGISRITVNDNPVKWFTPSHPIRVADEVLNRHFGGTYMAYLALLPPTERFDAAVFLADFRQRAAERMEALRAEQPRAEAVFGELREIAAERAARADVATEKNREAALKAIAAAVDERLAAATGDEAAAWDEAALFLDEERQRSEIFKEPEVLRYVQHLQEELLKTGIVGKSNSVADIVETVHRELLGGEDSELRIPERRRMVAECLVQFENSHRPQDLWHFVTPDYRTASIWVQLTSGDNKDMTHVVRAIDGFVKANPPPAGLRPEWFGLTYINVIWQNRMVWGMFQSLAGSFVVVFLLMTILFRSALWGLLSMVPLTVTIVVIYGALGLVGKSYDMPVAVLSSLALGLAVDFAIHFLARGRSLRRQYGSWGRAAPNVFGEPARAIVRNMIVIATGFTPLLLAPLTPYNTVGILLATILALSGLATLLVLPGLVRLLEARLFPTAAQPVGLTCNCVTCLISSVAAVVLLALNLHQYGHFGWTKLTWGSVIAVPVLALVCGILSRRTACRLQNPERGEQQ